MRTFFIPMVFAAGCTMTEAAAPMTEHIVAGTIHLAPELSRSVSPDDEILIVARRSPGSPPLAMKKVAMGDFPIRYELTDADLKMAGGLNGEVELMVRVDKDGNSNSRKPGDLVGRISAVRVGTHTADVTISEVLP